MPDNLHMHYPDYFLQVVTDILFQDFHLLKNLTYYNHFLLILLIPQHFYEKLHFFQVADLNKRVHKFVMLQPL